MKLRTSLLLVPLFAVVAALLATAPLRAEFKRSVVYAAENHTHAAEILQDAVVKGIAIPIASPHLAGRN